MTMTITKKKMAQEAREANVLHQEEELTKREKTLIDEEAAQADRDKIKQKKWVMYLIGKLVNGYSINHYKRGTKY